MADQPHEDLYGWQQLSDAVRALDAAWPSLPPADIHEAEELLTRAVALLVRAEERLYPRLGLTPPDRTPQPRPEQQNRELP